MKKILFIILSFLFLLNINLFAKDLQSNINIEKTNAEKLIYNADRYRDPLKSWLPEKAMQERPMDAGRPTEGIEMPAFIVQGMVWNTDMPQAIIDGAVYEIGDVFQEAKILDINKEGVKLLYRDSIILIKPEISKQTKKSRRER